MLVVSNVMQALARTTEVNCYTRAANDDCFYGGLRNRTKFAYVSNNPLSEIDPSGFLNKYWPACAGCGNYQGTQGTNVNGITTLNGAIISGNQSGGGQIGGDQSGGNPSVGGGPPQAPVPGDDGTLCDAPPGYDEGPLTSDPFSVPIVGTTPSDTAASDNSAAVQTAMNALNVVDDSTTFLDLLSLLAQDAPIYIKAPIVVLDGAANATSLTTDGLQVATSPGNSAGPYINAGVTITNTVFPETAMATAYWQLLSLEWSIANEYLLEGSWYVEGQINAAIDKDCKCGAE